MQSKNSASTSLQIADVIRFLSVTVVHTGLFDAVMTPGTVFPPIDHAVFAYTRPTRRDRVSFDMIFFRHNSSSQLQSGGGKNLGHDRLPCRPKEYVSRSNHPIP